MSPPTAVVFKSPAVGEPPIKFTPIPETEHGKSGGLASAAIPARDGLNGDLSATIGGKSVTVPISLR